MIYTWLTLGVSSGIWKRHGWSGSHSHTWQRPSRTSVENIGLSLTSHLFGYFLAVFAVDFEVTKIRFLQPCMLCMTHHLLLLPIVGFRTMEAGCDVAPTPFQRLAVKKNACSEGNFSRSSQSIQPWLAAKWCYMYQTIFDRCIDFLPFNTMISLSCKSIPNVKLYH